jgi:hypothetical protein
MSTKKNAVFAVVAAAAMLLLCLIMSSCFLPQYAVFLGTWKYTEENSSKTISLVFSEDGAFTWTEREIITADSGDAVDNVSYSDGTYTYDINFIYCTFSSNSAINSSRTLDYRYELSQDDGILSLGQPVHAIEFIRQ